MVKGPRPLDNNVKCQPLLRPEIGKVKTSVIFQMQQVPNTVTLSEDVSGFIHRRVLP